MSLPTYDDILNNDRDGASTLLLHFVKRTLHTLGNSSVTEIHTHTHAFQQKFGAMGNIDNFCNNMLQIFDTESLHNFLNKQLKYYTHIPNIVLKHLLQLYPHMPLNILTFSNSGLVAYCITQLTKQNQAIHTYISLSSPEKEGLYFQKNLLNQGVNPQNLTVIPDNQIEKVISTKDPLLIVIGCDRFTSNFVLNKIGTCKLLTLAKRYNVWVNVLASEAKKGETNQTHALLEWCKLDKNVRIITEVAIYE